MMEVEMSPVLKMGTMSLRLWEAFRSWKNKGIVLPLEPQKGLKPFGDVFCTPQ